MNSKILVRQRCAAIAFVLGALACDATKNTEPVLSAAATKAPIPAKKSEIDGYTLNGQKRGAGQCVLSSCGSVHDSPRDLEISKRIGVLFGSLG